MMLAAFDRCAISIKPGPDDRETLQFNMGPGAIAGFRAAAVARDIVGADKVRLLLQRVLDAIGNDARLIDNVLSAGMSMAGRAKAAR